ncbi:hypothetical protein K504DRAFT_532941 [Pleomassaria siparia CBS 279.74]|uniref:Uncharacterized protein n=1 Tax=Pleomassaria siparia CBS 279.74 TaxID=1314801 RepID=A0A6G1KBJ5_9PLEO|nr:hypothetical protein K504DRAFT_532941 [Pleomassaria siparia CBS 279.74]
MSREEKLYELMANIEDAKRAPGMEYCSDEQRLELTRLRLEAALHYAREELYAELKKHGELEGKGRTTWEEYIYHHDNEMLDLYDMWTYEKLGLVSRPRMPRAAQMAAMNQRTDGSGVCNAHQASPLKPPVLKGAKASTQCQSIQITLLYQVKELKRRYECACEELQIRIEEHRYAEQDNTAKKPWAKSYESWTKVVELRNKVREMQLEGFQKVNDIKALVEAEMNEKTRSPDAMLAAARKQAPRRYKEKLRAIKQTQRSEREDSMGLDNFQDSFLQEMILD